MPFIYSILAYVLAVPAMLYRSFVFLSLYNSFLLPVTNAPLTLVMAYGIILCWSFLAIKQTDFYLTSLEAKEDVPGKFNWERFISNYAVSLVTSSIYWAVGSVLALFLK